MLSRLIAYLLLLLMFPGLTALHNGFKKIDLYFSIWGSETAGITHCHSA